MPNLRIIYDNAVDRASISASSTAGNLSVSNLKNDKKSKCWRGNSVTETITLTWTSSEILSGIIMPFCNLTSTSEIIVKGYAEIADTTPIFDTGVVSPVRQHNLGLWEWGAIPLGVNSYSYGGGAYAVCWLDNFYSVKKITISINDALNTSGYVELSKIVAGSAWSPVFNTGFGMLSSHVDTSTRTRTDSGDLVTDLNPKYKTMSFDLSWMQSMDRQRFNEIIRNNGLSRSMFISLFPEDEDAEKEQTYQIYGKLSQTGGVTHTMHTIYAGRLDIEEI